MPPAERRDQVSPLSSVSTEQRCDVVIYTQASADTHTQRSCLAGCETTAASFVLHRASGVFNQMFLCSSLRVISLKLKEQRRPQLHTKVLNDIASPNRKNLWQSLHISR